MLGKNGTQTQVYCALTLKIKTEQKQLKLTRADLPSSGFGKGTVGKSGSGSACSLTGMHGLKPNSSTAICTHRQPTPCRAVYTIWMSVVEFCSLKDQKGRNVFSYLFCCQAYYQCIIRCESPFPPTALY